MMLDHKKKTLTDILPTLRTDCPPTYIPPVCVTTSMLWYVCNSVRTPTQAASACACVTARVNVTACVWVHVLPGEEHLCRWCVGVWMGSANAATLDDHQKSLIIRQSSTLFYYFPAAYIHIWYLHTKHQIAYISLQAMIASLVILPSIQSWMSIQPISNWLSEILGDLIQSSFYSPLNIWWGGCLSFPLGCLISLRWSGFLLVSQ